MKDDEGFWKWIWKYSGYTEDTQRALKRAVKRLESDYSRTGSITRATELFAESRPELSARTVEDQGNRFRTTLRLYQVYTSKFVEFPIPLRNRKKMAKLELPVNLTTSEAQRIHAIVDALVRD